jgi:hypothetical protein
MTCKVVRGDRDAKAHAVPCGGERDRRLGGFYLGPLGFDWLIGSIVITTVLAIGWMRAYWNP